MKTVIFAPVFLVPIALVFSGCSSLWNNQSSFFDNVLSPEEQRAVISWREPTASACKPDDRSGERAKEKAPQKEKAPSQADSIEVTRTLALQGNSQAQCRLGDAYLGGCGVAKNLPEAVQWYRKAAEQGHAAAQYNLSVCYYKGQGVNLNPAEATQWLTKSAKQGYPAAQYNLGMAYFIGSNVNKNPGEGVKWLQKSADQGLAQAQCNLGIACANGEGILKDIKAAYGWLLLAKNGGSKDAASVLTALKRSLSSQEREEAQTWAQQWKPKLAPGSKGAHYDIR